VANRRIVTLGFLFAVVWLFMLGRVFHVQVLAGKDYQNLATSQSVRRDILVPRRGEILDNRLTRLAVNADLKLASSGSGRDWTLTRVCPNGALAGQILGNVGQDGFGQGGLELSYDKELRGSDGWRYARHDVKNRYYPEFDPRAEHAVDGGDVVLTLDSRLQAIAEQALERGVQRVGAKRGTALLVDPGTGDLLAIANYPFYNPNARDRAIGDAWKNLAVSMVYEPGSTFKIITAAALLEEKVITPQDTLDGEQGKWSLPGQLIRDTHPYGRISFSDAMAYSSNICFAKAGGRIQAATFYRYLRSFGFGMKTGVGLPAEEGGLLKAVADWSGRTQLTISFGHELSVTPLQLVMAASAVANDGVLMKPRIVKAFRHGVDGALEENPTRKVRQVISTETAIKVRKMLQGVVDYGTAVDIRRPDFDIAGKTGTSEKIDPLTGKYLPGTFHSSFVGMVPADKPTLVCLVMLDEPTQFKFGGQSAAPIFREIMDRMVVMSEPVVALIPHAIRTDSTVFIKHPNSSDHQHAMAQFQPLNLGNSQVTDSLTLPDVRGGSLV
jgi:cell division protein FtsI/penicillin-binding protein 2